MPVLGKAASHAARAGRRRRPEVAGMLQAKCRSANPACWHSTGEAGLGLCKAPLLPGHPSHPGVAPSSPGRAPAPTDQKREAPGELHP